MKNLVLFWLSLLAVPTVNAQTCEIVFSIDRGERDVVLEARHSTPPEDLPHLRNFRAAHPSITRVLDTVIPGKVYDVHLPERAPERRVEVKQGVEDLGPWATDPVLSRAIEIGYFRDGKAAVDLAPKNISVTDRAGFVHEAELNRRASEEHWYRFYQRQGWTSADARKQAKKDAELEYLAELIPKLFEAEPGMDAVGSQHFGNFGRLPLEGTDAQTDRVAVTKNLGVLASLGRRMNRVFELFGDSTRFSDLGITVATLKQAWFKLERNWGLLAMKPRHTSNNSFLPVPYEFFVAGFGRFNEGYYWDSLLGFVAMIKTRMFSRSRLDMAQKLTENFLFLINEYGIVPNGMRDYYLGRSQPPVVYKMVHDVFYLSLEAARRKSRGREVEAEKQRVRTWLKDRALPILLKDYQFWMTERFDEELGLNFHSEKYDRPLPEEWHGKEPLGATHKDEGAIRESGTDVTNVLKGKTQSKFMPNLNAILYMSEIQLARLAREAGQEGVALELESNAKRRATAMRRYLYNMQTRAFHIYDKSTGLQETTILADTFTPMFAGMTTAQEARDLVDYVLKPKFLKKGGILSSTDMASPEQWDGAHGWAIWHYFLVDGLLLMYERYKNTPDAHLVRDFPMVAKDVSARYMTTILANFSADSLLPDAAKEEHFYEKYDVVTLGLPVETDGKYPTQKGFLWTNGFAVFAMEVLGFNTRPELKREPHLDLEVEEVETGL